MKKLINLIESDSMVSSMGLSNVTTDNDNTKYDTISDSLVKDINTAAKNAGLKVTITTAKSGHSEMTKSGHKSRHTTGDAVDISIINGKKITKDLGDKLANELKKLGYDTSGNESGNNKAVLWQVADHYDHIHVSNTSDTSSSSIDSDDETSTDTDSDSFATSFITDLIANKFGLSESKQNRVLKDIEKIKNLL
jgi:hypothetical protein